MPYSVKYMLGVLCYIISKFIMGSIEYSLYIVAVIDCGLKMILIKKKHLYIYIYILIKMF